MIAETPYLPGLEPHNPEEPLDLELMTPEEVSRLHSEAAEAYSAAWDREDWDARELVRHKLEALNEGIAHLPMRNIQKAREMYHTLGRSAVMEDRNLVAPHMHQLARWEEMNLTADRNAAINLWIDLIDDEDSMVQEGARMSADEAIEGELLTPITVGTLASGLIHQIQFGWH